MQAETKFLMLFRSALFQQVNQADGKRATDCV